MGVGGEGQLPVKFDFRFLLPLWCVGLAWREMEREGQDRNGCLDTGVSSFGGPMGGTTTL